jgi:hypothetical protein
MFLQMGPVLGTKIVTERLSTPRSVAEFRGGGLPAGDEGNSLLPAEAVDGGVAVGDGDIPLSGDGGMEAAVPLTLMASCWPKLQCLEKVHVK